MPAGPVFPYQHPGAPCGPEAGCGGSLVLALVHSAQSPEPFSRVAPCQTFFSPLTFVLVRTLHKGDCEMRDKKDHPFSPRFSPFTSTFFGFTRWSYKGEMTFT